MPDSINSIKFFSVPHDFFEEPFATKYTLAERYFYITLRRLKDRSQNEGEWHLFRDRPRSTDEGLLPGFRTYGLSARVCKSGRKKLKADELIDFRHVYSRKGHRIGTEYKLLDERFVTLTLLRNLFR